MRLASPFRCSHPSVADPRAPEFKSDERLLNPFRCSTSASLTPVSLRSKLREVGQPHQIDEPGAADLRAGRD